MKPLDEYVGAVPLPIIVVFRPFPDLSFHPVTVVPSVVVTVTASYASNHIASWGRVEGRNTSPDTSEISNVMVLLSVASYHMIGPADSAP